MRDGRRGWRPVLLVLPVLLGVLGMHALVAPAAAPAPASTPTAAVTMADDGTTQHGPSFGAADTPAGHGDHDGAAHLLHLCLAVLAAVGLVLPAVWLLLGRLPLPTSSTPARRRARSMPAARPPPVPRRLAQLCVLRN